MFLSVEHSEFRRERLPLCQFFERSADRVQHPFLDWFRVAPTRSAFDFTGDLDFAAFYHP
jgi:hypothetical protein